MTKKENNKTKKITTYNEKFGMYVTSVFPILSEEEKKEQSIAITKAIRSLIDNKKK